MIPFDCARFTSWLDAGAPNSAEAAAHAASCDACASLASAGRAVDALLVRGPRDASAATVPAGFADRVLARVAVTRQDIPAATATARALAGFELALRRDAFPWWVRAAGHPACVLALVLAAVSVFFWPQLVATAQGAPEGSAAVFALLTGAVLPFLVRVDAIAGGDPVAAAGLALLAGGLLVPLSAALFRFGVAIAAVPFAPRIPRSGPGAPGTPGA